MKQAYLSTDRLPNRWLIAVMGTFLMLMLGTVYAWSFFQKPIVTAMGWSNAQAAWAFSLAILFLGFSAAWGGINLPRVGPVKLSMLGGALFAVGYLLGGIALKYHSLPLLYLGFGVIGGIGMGFGYVTPVATVGKWFPDKKGLATGMVVMGFGFGALLMSKVIGPALMSVTGGDTAATFMLSGLVMCLTLVFGFFLKNPPAGYIPAGYVPPTANAGRHVADSGLTAMDCIVSVKWLLMWLVFFCNITAGIMFIGFQSPMLQDILGRSSPGMDAGALAAAGATLIAVSSLFNGMGRFLWGGLSDKIGRIQTFRIILASQVIVFIILGFISSPLLFSMLVCYVLLCYGGGFGTMPSFIHDVFGARLMPVVYGAILTAWSLAGVAGPQIVAVIKDTCRDGAGRLTFTIGACLLTAGFICSLFISNSRFSKKTDKAAESP
jgi:OFA family oxalate/formate antiporter-like MFS transporter